MDLGFLRRRAVAAVAGLVLLAPAALAADADAVGRGRSLAELNCARCHATGPEGESSVPEAPPFRYLKMKYPVETLAESLAEGIGAGHPAVPELAFEAAEIEDLLAYLKTL